LAIKRGLKLSEYGVFGGKKGDKYICGRTEEEIYKILDLEYIEPELRESTGEIEAARQAKLPKLVGYDDLMGDLQVQSNWTDGEDSIEDLARAALKLGHKYIAITDHTKRLAMTHGLDERRLLKQMAEKVIQAKGVEGVKLAISGRLGGAEMARYEWIKRGRVPLQTLRANIDYAHAEANTTYGVIGVKAWIYKGDIFDKNEKENAA